MQRPLSLFGGEREAQPLDTSPLQPLQYGFQQSDAYTFTRPAGCEDQAAATHNLPPRPIRPLPVRTKHVLPPRQDEPALSLPPASTDSATLSTTPIASSQYDPNPATPTAFPASSTFSAANDTLALSFETASYNSSSSADPYVSTSPTTTSYTSSSSSFSRPWRVSTKATSSHAPEETPYVPGVILPLVLGGDDDDQAVYSVQMDFGHGTLDGGDVNDISNRRRWAAAGPAKRRPTSYWDGGSPQTVNLQVDLGSSDLWVASTNCTSPDCNSAPALFNASLSLDADTNMQFKYHTGQVSGEIYWEQVLLGGFGIGYQVFLAADTVTDEDLTGGNFTGVLGLALPANSIILSQIAGSTSGAPDGATFLDNLFGSGVSAPTQRLFSLSLARREDVRTSSTLGIGAVSTSYCPVDACKPNYLPIAPQPSLGATGFLHWRLPLQGISATTWTDEEKGTGPTAKNITLGLSQVDSGSSTPLAVLDSGGVAILVGYKQWIDSIYGAYGIQSSADGLYRLPCTTQIALSFTIGGEEYAVHPLDMSWPDPSDPSQATCIGALQYSSSLGRAGDFVLGSSFLKNVYSIFQYPDNVGRGTWQPTVGLISLTNASVASQDFYAVRVQRQSLSDVSSDHQSGIGVSNPASTDTGTQASADSLQSKKVLSSAGIAGISVAALFVFTAAVFCAWWFWLRRRFGKDGTVDYSAAGGRLRADDAAGGSAMSLRSKKHQRAQRQRSMIEGYGGEDYEDSWLSTTEGGDSIRLGYIPEELEMEDLAAQGMCNEAMSVKSERDVSEARRSVANTQATDEGEIFGDERVIANTAPVIDPANATGQRRRESSASTARTLSLGGYQDAAVGRRSPARQASALPSSGSSWSMSGPFPSPAGNRSSSARLDSSPMYDIRSSDYFDITPTATTVGGTQRRGRERSRSNGESVESRPRDPKETRRSGGMDNIASPEQ